MLLMMLGTTLQPLEGHVDLSAKGSPIEQDGTQQRADSRD